MVSEVEDLLIADTPVVGLREQDTYQMWDRVAGRREAGERKRLEIDTEIARGRRWFRRGVRQCLTEEEGDGFWDFFKPSDYFQVSVTAAKYRENKWIQVEGERYFKLRVLLSGQLLRADGHVLISGPQALVFISPGPGNDGYFIPADVETSLVVLHCRPELLSDTLGLEEEMIPPPFDQLHGPARPASLHRIPLSAESLHSAQRIIDSRRGLPTYLRVPFLQALSTHIICRMLADISNQRLVRHAESRLSVRDLKCIQAAKNHLARHFAAPPAIVQLARMVGVNQTKLKAGFKQVFGTTIYGYITQCRMERAAMLLVSRKYAVADVSYMVGYEHPSNFTCAFKKHFGYVPRACKRPAAPPGRGL